GHEREPGRAGPPAEAHAGNPLQSHIRQEHRRRPRLHHWMIMARIVGIDLGTTNSLVAYMKEGVPTVIPGRGGRTMVPSVVAMTDNGLIVGDPAKEHLTRNPERTVYSVKRFMGKGLADVQSELAYFPYSLTEQGGVIRIKLGEKSYSPPQISAMILK